MKKSITVQFYKSPFLNSFKISWCLWNILYTIYARLRRTFRSTLDLTYYYCLRSYKRFKFTINVCYFITGFFGYTVKSFSGKCPRETALDIWFIRSQQGRSYNEKRNARRSTFHLQHAGETHRSTNRRSICQRPRWPNFSCKPCKKMTYIYITWIYWSDVILEFLSSKLFVQ